MRVIKAHYKDSNYEQDVIITDLENRTYSLSFELDGIRFIGIWFSSFILADTAQFEEAKEKFKIVKHGPYDGNYVYALQRYNICASIPVSVYDKKADKTIDAIVKYEVSMKQDINYKFLTRRCDSNYVLIDGAEGEAACIVIDDKNYGVGIMPCNLDEFLSKCSEQMKDGYRLMSCFTCQYSDYHPCGGLMQCFRNHKEDCLLVHNKADYFKYLEPHRDVYVCSEFGFCDDYHIRDTACGYRDFLC